MVETSDAWIVERTGIRYRRLASAEEATSDLAVQAARRALDDAGLGAADLDAIIVATVTPDHPLPSTACLVQRALGARRAAAFDLAAACTGFIYGLALAEGLIAAGRHETVLVVGAETLSRIVDYTDRTTCILFGDGAGAAVVTRARSAEHGLLWLELGADGDEAELLVVPAGGSRHPASVATVAERLHYVKMDGHGVFRYAVEVMGRSVASVLGRLGLCVEDVDLVVPHQANRRIVEAAARFAGVPTDRIFHTIEEYGNMSSASIPVSLDEARRRGLLEKGDLVLLVGFGGGMTRGAALLKWGLGSPEAGQGG